MAKGNEKKPKPGDDDYVGKNHPPKHSQFQPGQSGNPKGRRNNSRNADTIIKSALGAKVALRRDGKLSTVEVREAVLLKLVEKALSGDHRSLNKVIDLMLVHDEDDRDSRGSLSVDDSAILMRFIEQATDNPDKPDATGAGDES